MNIPMQTKLAFDSAKIVFALAVCLGTTWSCSTQTKCQTPVEANSSLNDKKEAVGEHGKYLRVSDDLELYYEEFGQGDPMLLVPGWTGTTDFFAPQIKHFAKTHRVLTFDPRSQGRSTKTNSGNNYNQHGRDLNAFINAIGLNDVVILAVSFGCLDVYSYVNGFGHEKIKSIVFVDCPPKPLASAASDWAEVPTAAHAMGFVRALQNDHAGTVEGFIKTMYTREIKKAEWDWMWARLSLTPADTSILLLVDGMFSDYTETAKKLDNQVPVLHIVKEENGERAKTWLKGKAPHAEVQAFGKHLMLSEFPDKFNGAVDAFLKSH